MQGKSLITGIIIGLIIGILLMWQIALIPMANRYNQDYEQLMNEREEITKKYNELANRVIDLYDVWKHYDIGLANESDVLKALGDFFAWWERG